MLCIVYLGVPTALLKSILCCLALFVFVGFSVYLIKLGLILSKNSDIFRQIFLFITLLPCLFFFFSVTFSLVPCRSAVLNLVVGETTVCRFYSVGLQHLDRMWVTVNSGSSSGQIPQTELFNTYLTTTIIIIVILCPVHY